MTESLSRFGGFGAVSRVREDASLLLTTATESVEKRAVSLIVEKVVCLLLLKELKFPRQTGPKLRRSGSLQTN